MSAMYFFHLRFFRCIATHVLGSKAALLNYSYYGSYYYFLINCIYLLEGPFVNLFFVNHVLSSLIMFFNISNYHNVDLQCMIYLHRILIYINLLKNVLFKQLCTIEFLFLSKIIPLDFSF